MNPNGQADGESRLDRLEQLFLQGAERNEKAHEGFEEEHKRLLTSQVLMVEIMKKLELKVIEIADKLDGLIGVVNGLVKKPAQ